MSSKIINRVVRTLILSTCLFTYAGAGQAQEERRAAGAANDRNLAAVELSFTQMENAKTDADRDRHAAPFEAQMDAYAKAMLADFDAVMKQAEAAARLPPSSISPGSFAGLKAFEDLAIRHEGRMKQLDSRASRMKPPGTSGSILEPVEGGKVVLVALGWRMLGTDGDFFISPVEKAAIALAVYTVCNKPNNAAACLVAILKGNADRIIAHNVFKACWASHANVWPKWLRAARRAVCTAVLVARLA